MTKRLLNSDCMNDWHHVAAELHEIDMRVESLARVMLKATVGTDMLPAEMSAILCVLNQIQEYKTAFMGLAQQCKPSVEQSGEKHVALMAPPIVQNYHK